jgi:DNA-binding MarR family transcriptional regulator
MKSDPVLAVLAAYPRIYHACHRRHPRTRTGPDGISARDAWILGHLERERPVSPARLAEHMAVGASTVSEAVKRLERLGYLERRRSEEDARRVDLFLSEEGAEAMRDATVLDEELVKRMLALLAPEERARAVEGITLLAEAAAELNAREGTRWDEDDG